MSLIINNVSLNKSEILSLIKENGKIQAIKYIRDKTKLGLKESKDIIDNLEEDPNFYDGKDYKVATEDVRFSERPQKRKPFKGNHIMVNGKSKFKNYIIVFLLICIGLLLYLFL